MNLISGPGRKGILPKSYNQTMKHEPGYSASPNLQKNYGLKTSNDVYCFILQSNLH